MNTLLIAICVVAGIWVFLFSKENGYFPNSEAAANFRGPDIGEKVYGDIGMNLNMETMKDFNNRFNGNCTTGTWTTVDTSSYDFGPGTSKSKGPYTR